MKSNNLENKKIVITRPIERSKVLVDLIESYGAKAIVVPTLELKLVKSKELMDICYNIDSYDWIIFTSPAGVKSFFNVFDQRELNPSIAVIGIKTEEELLKYGFKPDIVPNTFTAEGLLESFEDIDLVNKNIALPRTLSARDVLPEGLKNYGADVMIAEAYTSDIPEDKEKIIQLSKKILNHEIDIISFTSPLTVHNLFKVFKEDIDTDYKLVLDQLRNNITVLSIGPITANALKEYDIKCIQPKRYTVKDMFELLL